MKIILKTKKYYVKEKMAKDVNVCNIIIDKYEIYGYRKV